MADTWFVIARDGQQQGPHEESQIIALIQSGRAGAESLCWCEGMGDWIPLSQVAAFAPALAAAETHGPGVSEALGKGLHALKQTFDWGKKAAARKIETTKIRMRINSAKKAREQWLIRLGEIVYRLPAAADDPPTREAVAAILDCDRQIAEGEQEIARVEAS